jgi:hypothetical protein
MDMKINLCICCKTFPCADVKHDSYVVPDVDVKVEDITIIMISESAPPDPKDYYYAGKEALFEQTTVLAFQEAGAKVASIEDILGLGVYLTTAVKCGKTAYGIQTGTINECSLILEQELAIFPNVQVYLLMGDVAIKAVNQIARRAGQGRVIPAGSTYKIRGEAYYFHGLRALPSYLQAGPSFFIEKVKRQMIAEDIATALSLVN